MNSIGTEVINTTNQVRDLVDWLEAPAPFYAPATEEAIICVDLEGVDLCREGSISIITLVVDNGVPIGRVYLIDVHSLGDQDIRKVFFDVRNDSDALFAHFGVALKGVEDVQLMESATRKTTTSRKFLSGLSKCVEENVSIVNKASWKQAKERGEQLFKAEYGGSYEVFNQRPIPQDIITYCVGDVQFLPELWKKFRKNKARAWRDLIREKSLERVLESQKPDYQPYGRDRAKSPWTQQQNNTLDTWNYVPPIDYFDEDFDDWQDDPYYDDGPDED